MDARYLSAKAAARRLGISASRLYDWLAVSNTGQFVIRGQPVTITYYQGGPKGQGRIRIEAREVERLLALMRVVPSIPPRQSQPRRTPLSHITVPLGRPDD